MVARNVVVSAMRSQVILTDPFRSRFDSGCRQWKFLSSFLRLGSYIFFLFHFFFPWSLQIQLGLLLLFQVSDSGLLYCLLLKLG